MRNTCSLRVCQSTAIALSLWLGTSHPHATGAVFDRDLLQPGNATQAALNPRNYDFLGGVDESNGLVRLDIRPKRRDQLLVEGSILLDGDTADILQVGGLLAKPPSFWTRRVHVERRYARIGGVHVSVSMTSTADVLVVGQASFAMSYCYAEINGVSVASCDD